MSPTRSVVADQWLLAQASMKYFATKFLGMRWPNHYQEWTELLENSDRLLIECPRGHGKSFYFSLAYPLWRVIRGKTDILLVSYSEDQVRRLIRELRMTVESNPFLESLRPSTKEVWGTDQMSFANGSFISGLGFGTSSRGRHPSVIVVDDPLKDLGGMTDEDQERAYFGVITGMAMDGTKLITVGTPVNFGDLLEKIDRNEAYTKWKRPALTADGDPIFPSLWSKESLTSRRKEMGSLNFAREFLLQRIDPTTQPFKREYETLYGTEHSPLPQNFACIGTVCDPAYNEKDGDYTAIVTVGFTHGNHAYVLEAKRFRRDNPGVIVDEIFKTIRAYEPQVVGLPKKKGEAVSYTFEERRTRENRWDFKYVELPETRSKTDKSRIGGLVPRWEARTIHLHKNMTDFLKEIYEFRLDDGHAHDDLIDALAHCFNPEMAQPNSGKQRKPLPEQRASGKSLYVVGQVVTPSRRLEPSQELARRLDRRIGEAA